MTQPDTSPATTIPRNRLAWPLVLLVLAATAAIYWPGLHGGYLFDDYPNIVDNKAVHVDAMRWDAWRGAALSSPSQKLKRPLAMLSFAVNHYLVGLDPFWFKLTNLALHLLCGLLLFVVLRKLLRLWRRVSVGHNDAAHTRHADLLAAVVACAWLVAPINLTPVLYVVQRMTSLAQLFVLAGLWLYTHGRARQCDGKNGWPWMLGGLAGAAALGVGAKETAVLLPAYALACELALFGFRDAAGRRSKSLIGFFTVLIGAPLALGLAWLLPHALHGGFNHRAFTLGERLLTECRVLVDYIVWTLTPYPGMLSFYHDDMALSTGWLSPPTTVACAGLLAVLAAAAFACLRRAPLIALGLLWFFAAHLLTATIIPLELVFEHRNYFASAGLLLAAASALMHLGRHTALRLPAYTLLALLIAWPAAVTAMRSLEWSSPLRLNASEAQTHPRSPRAQYELGRALIIATGYDGDPAMLDRARQAFLDAMRLPGASILPEQGLLVLAAHRGHDANPAWWRSAIDKLRRRPPRAEEVDAIHGLLKCQAEGPCQPQTREMLQLYLAALEHAPHNANLLTSYAQFAAYQLNDHALARRVANQALAASGNPGATRETLAPILAAPGAGAATSR